MSGLDLFAWIILIILIATLVFVFCLLGWLPGHVAKSRGHPWPMRSGWPAGSR